MNKTSMLLVRIALGLAGGWFLQKVFFPQTGWYVVLIMAALIVGAAYLSEAWRLKKKG